MTDLCDLSALEMRRLIGVKDVSPVEILASCRRRIDAVNPLVNAVTATCWERAEQEAQRAEAAVLRGDPLGALHGLPIGIKDLDDTEGLTTTYGSPIYRKHVPPRDEWYVASIRRAGGIVVGKTNVPQLGLGGHSTNPVYGATGNPFDVSRIAGGSSGGSAAALSAGMLPLCSGSDSGGSSRNPAAFCGVVGLRQSAGIVPQPGRVFGWSPFPIKGPMARDVADACLMLGAMSGQDTADPFSHPFDSAALSRPIPVDLSTLRVAFSEDLGFALVDQRIRETFRRARTEFEAVFRASESGHPDNPHGNDLYELLRAVTAVASLGKHMDSHREILGENNIMMYEKGRNLSGETIAWAQMEQTLLYHRFNRFFVDHDLLITPTVGIPPHAVDQMYAKEVDGKPTRTFMHTLALTYGITVTGLPAISIPCGLEPTGTPFHLQLVAGKGKDAFLLGAAHALMVYLAGKPGLERPVPDLSKLIRR